MFSRALHRLILSSRHLSTSLPASQAHIHMSTEIPPKMKAAVVEQPGPIENLSIKEVDTPKPGKGQVLIKVEWCGVNYIDNYFRGGIYKVPFPLILGNEPSGTVVALGSGVDPSVYGFNVGDKVGGYFPPSGYAEYAAGPADRTVKLPEGISTKDAATSILQGMTALSLVKESHPVKKGEWILVHAAAGGVGLLLCQLIKNLGAHAIGTVSTPEKAELAKANGAEHVILYNHGDFASVTKEVLELTGGEGVHAVLDGVGKDTFEEDFNQLRRKGTLVTFGNASGPVPEVAPLKLAGKNLKLCRPTLANYVATREEFRGYADELFDLVKGGKLRIARYKEEGYPFTTEGVRQTQYDITSRKTTAKLIVKVSE